MISTRTALATLAVIAAAVPANADVLISTAPTSNMSCSGGVCQPTATDAVLNVTDLENLLASGNVEVTTTGSGIQANNIDVTAAFSWSAANGLTLDADQSITFSADVQNLSTGNVSLITNDGGDRWRAGVYDWHWQTRHQRRLDQRRILHDGKQCQGAC